MEKANRVGWVDVARGLAMIFVYLGHWSTARITAFAYSFHLQMFFIIAGFFCIKNQKQPAQFAKEKICAITAPMILWACISFVINGFDVESVNISEVADLFLKPAAAQPNYWFFPVVLSVSIIYAYIYIYA